MRASEAESYTFQMVKLSEESIVVVDLASRLHQFFLVQLHWE